MAKYWALGDSWWMLGVDWSEHWMSGGDEGHVSNSDGSRAMVRSQQYILLFPFNVILSFFFYYFSLSFLKG